MTAKESRNRSYDAAFVTLVIFSNCFQRRKQRVNNFFFSFIRQPVNLETIGAPTESTVMF
jgi:hypothetical protein